MATETAILLWVVGALAGSMLYLVGFQPPGYLFLFLSSLYRIQDNVSASFRIVSNGLNKSGWFAAYPTMRAKDEF